MIWFLLLICRVYDGNDFEFVARLAILIIGGLELLYNSVKIHNVNVEMQNGLTMKDLLSWIRTHMIKERPEMFMKGDTVRPGVLALVNDCDWELSGQLDTTLEEKDVVVFISTLHGGSTRLIVITLGNEPIVCIGTVRC
ncbi:ubiquitin-related modifier 1-like protein 2 [Pyrus ussuriensis x Pyrus communis]|uniref:Ubiquitin-related modifier 1 homolog n=1 Tax=Pyrus ussuriensis x Pyrus communis TaxID=2448454 RepID=A0A5N5FB34_9ROSA|nr:ubiquitin-related modifier 1-like protein 2 [Pyrus ussuriensis x Pyrus communis]